eukprot:1067033-Pyramimonas_sp.AAC.1
MASKHGDGGQEEHEERTSRQATLPHHGPHRQGLLRCGTQEAPTTNPPGPGLRVHQGTTARRSHPHH